MMHQTLPPPRLRLPRAREHYRGGVALAAVVHGLAVLALVVGQGVGDDAPRAVGAPGPVGGGGGGIAVVRYVELAAPAPAPAQPAATPERPEPETVALPQPVVQRTAPAPILSAADAFPVDIPTKVGPGAGAGGAGTGGGVGTGQGTGTGSATGPGTGGEGGSVFPPDPVLIIPPADRPKSVRGREFAVHFWVDASGRVTRVEVEPEIPDAAYRKKFVDQMYQFRFSPARRPDGTPVRARISIRVTL